MHLTHLVIDDFFDRPDEIRRQALSLPYPPRPAGAYYPGRNAAQKISLPGIENLVSEITRERVKLAGHASNFLPRMALEGEKSRQQVHVDFCHWSGIIYLSRDQDCVGGTHFFSHKRTGWESAPVWPGMAEEAGYKNADEALQSILKEDANDRSKWEERMMIPMKYNRFVLFRGYLWHDAGRSFGTSPETSRLILPVFFENVNF